MMVVLILVLALGADIIKVPFPNTTILGASIDLLPNTTGGPNTLGVWVCCISKGECGASII
jgi:hypothetical protein